MSRVFVFLAILFATPAAAFTKCDEAWFVRNLVCDRAGYCFGSALGQALFDNGDCRSSNVSLNPQEQDTVTAIKQFEESVGCSVNTKAKDLDLPHAPLLRELEVLPVPTEYESACMGWTGAQVALLVGPRDGARVASYAEAGDDIFWEYDFYGVSGEWQFLSLYAQGSLIGMGWTRTFIDDGLCSAVAG